MTIFIKVENKEQLKGIVDHHDDIKYPVEIPIVTESKNEEDELHYWELFNYEICSIDDIKGLVNKLIFDEFFDLKSDKPVLYAATYSLMVAIFTYLICHEGYEKYNDIFFIKKFVDSFNNGEYKDKKDNQQSVIFDKIRLIEPNEYCLFYYDTFLINTEEICLNAVSLFSYICCKYINEFNTMEYIRKEKAIKVLDNKLININKKMKKSLVPNDEDIIIQNNKNN